MSGLYPLRLAAPGFYGLNTQLNTAPGLQWASQATNCVIDAKGRLAARKGRDPAAGGMNLLTRSEEFDHATWEKNNATVVANTGTAPDGTLTADEITVTGASYHLRQQTNFLHDGDTYTFSVWARQISGTPTSVNLDISDGDSDFVALTSSFQRITQTSVDGGFGATIFVDINFGGDGVFEVWGAQLERASSVGPYAKTVAIPTAVAGAMRAIFEQVTSDGTEAIILAANNKLYSGTTALTDITATADDVTGITADHWQFQNIANKCVGFQAGHDPIVRTTGNFSLLQQSITAWVANTVYAVGDVVRAGSGNETLYFHCTTTGTSHATTEPTWDLTVGDTTADNTVVWTTRKMPNGNACHSAFGRIWVTSDGDASVVEFSDTLLPHIFRGGAAGTLDLKEVWGGDQVVAISSIEDYLVIFGKRAILLYSGAFDPSTMVLEEKIDGVGCIARDTPANTGNDLLFLSASGVRSLARAIEAGGRQSLGDLSVNVRDEFISEVGAETAANVKAVYHEAEGFYAVFLTDDDITWVFDRRFPNPDGSAKVTRWTGIGVRSAYSASDRTLYFGGDGIVATYAGYNDGAAGTYVLAYRSTWVDFGDADASGRIGLASRLKFPKSWRLRVLAGTNYDITYVWGYDYSESISSLTAALNVAAAPSEWGIAEWGLGEWSGGDVFGDARIHPDSHGQVLRIGMTVTVDAAAIAFQEVLLAAKLGRLAF